MTLAGKTPRHHPSLLEAPRTAFAHPSERAFATLLSLYGIAWVYEPLTLPLQWGSDGKVLQAFCPDFYLPERESFVELTVAEPRRFARKLAKVKLANQLYPELEIALVGPRELHELCQKHGISLPLDHAA